MMKRGLSLICALMAMVMVLSMAAGIAEETRKPYTVGSVSMTVPVEWDESAANEEDGMSMYGFEFNQDDKACEAILMGLDLGAILESMGMPAEAMSQLTPEVWSTMMPSLLGMSDENLTIESKTMGGKEVMVMSIPEEGMNGSAAMFLEGAALVIVAVNVPVGMETQGDAVLSDIIASAQTVNEQ